MDVGLFWKLRGLQYPGTLLCPTAAAHIDFHPHPLLPPFQFCSIKSPVCWKEQYFHVALKPAVLRRGQNLGQLLTITIDASLSTKLPGLPFPLLH